MEGWRMKEGWRVKTVRKRLRVRKVKRERDGEDEGGSEGWRMKERLRDGVSEGVKYISRMRGDGDEERGRRD